MMSQPSKKPFDSGDARKLEAAHVRMLEGEGEPKQGFSFMPIAIVFIVALAVFWGAIYMGKNAADFRKDVYNLSYRPVQEKSVQAVQFDPIARGKKLFDKNCKACHQATGQGVAGAFPPLVKSPWVLGDEERIVKILLRGLEGPIEVEGATYNGNMPSYGENGINWSDRDIAAVLTWVRQAWGNQGSAVSESVVGKVRAEISERDATWTVQELLKDHPMEK